jgi:H+/Cl- antiporter ClcA
VVHYTNVLGSIFKPRPYPAFVLLAFICGFLGVFLMRASRIAGYAVIVEDAARWKVGDSGKVRYHPDFPEMHRWLE